MPLTLLQQMRYVAYVPLALACCNDALEASTALLQ